MSAELKVESEKLNARSKKSNVGYIPYFQLSTFSFQLFLSATLLMAHLLPWASHSTAALTLSGNDLAFFTHFTPGAGIFRNEWFYLPVWASALQLISFAMRRGRVSNMLGAGVGCAIAMLALPRYQFLVALRAAVRQHGVWVGLTEFQFGLQLILTCAVVVAILVLAMIAPRLPQPGTSLRLVILLDFVCLLMCIVPVIGLLSVQSAIETLYQSKIAFGLGWWLTLFAILGLTGSAVLKLRQLFIHK